MYGSSSYITEIAPRRQRGMLVSMPQFMATTGICAGYFTCYGTIHIASSISWRLPFIIAAILAVGLAISCLYLPESPRWLLLRGRRDDALRESERLNLSRVEVEKDILTIASRSQSQPSLWQGLSVVFYRRYRARTTLGLFILGMIQLCGIDGVIYVSSSGPLKLLASVHSTDYACFLSTRRYYLSRLAYQAVRLRSLHLACLQSLCLPSLSLQQYTPIAGVVGPR